MNLQDSDFLFSRKCDFLRGLAMCMTSLCISIFIFCFFWEPQNSKYQPQWYRGKSCSVIIYCKFSQLFKHILMLFCHVTHSLLYLDNFFEGRVGTRVGDGPKNGPQRTSSTPRWPYPQPTGPTMAQLLHYKQLGNYPNGLPSKTNKIKGGARTLFSSNVNLDLPAIYVGLWVVTCDITSLQGMC